MNRTARVDHGTGVSPVRAAFPGAGQGDRNPSTGLPSSIPSPGTPGEGKGGGSIEPFPTDCPLPSPPREYRGRGKGPPCVVKSYSRERAPFDAPAHDVGPERDDFRADVLHGLRQARKQIPCKYFYDQRGSQLFDRICELPEYYPTRTELGIMARHGAEMAGAMGPRCRIVEYGSGSSTKTRVLLDHAQDPCSYVPLDISREHLLDAAARLAACYPGLNILPVCADYTSRFTLPDGDGAARTIIYFPGSTIGNFEPQEARAFLQGAAGRAGPGGGMLIGVDLKKDPATLHAAYNDTTGVTATFNLNLLQRINRELQGDFNLDQFAHYAFYNPRLGRIEMHLVSRRAQTVSVGDERFDIREGEAIFTESSYKYTLDQFASLASVSGWKVETVWTDEWRLFSVQYLVKRDE
jgi:dimethylhistidine N-methyltransferase